MNKRTRLFVLGASGVLAAGLATAGVASYVTLDGLGITAVADPHRLSYVPADVHFVAYADVRHVMDSELRRKLQPDTGTSPAPSTPGLLADTGINLETDVDSILVVWLPGSSPSPGMPPLLLARGRFDASRIEASIVQRGGAASDYQDTRLAVVEPGNGRPAFGVAFLDEGFLAVGMPDALHKVLDTKASGAGSVRDDDELMRLVDRVDEADAWTVARFDAITEHTSLPPMVAGQLPDIRWFAAGGDVDGGLSGTIHAETSDAAAAQNLRDVIRGFVALARMQAAQQPELTELINSMQLSGDGTTVTLGFAVPPATIDKLGALARLRARPQAPPAKPLRSSPRRFSAPSSPSI